MFCVCLLEEKLYFIRYISFINLRYPNPSLRNFVFASFPKENLPFFFELFVSSFFIAFFLKKKKRAEKDREGTPFLKKDGYNIFVMYHSQRFIKYKIVSIPYCNKSKKIIGESSIVL